MRKLSKLIFSSISVKFILLFTLIFSNLLLQFGTVSSQVAYSTTFSSYSGWTKSSGWSYSSCNAGGDATIRHNLWSSSNSNYIYRDLGTTNGGTITVDLSYSVINYSCGSAAANTTFVIAIQ